MPILQIEHAVSDFDAWKRAFDSDPVGRERGGVRSYRIARPVDDPNYIVVELAFASTSEAETFLVGLRGLWRQVEAEGLVTGPQTRIIDTVESKEY